MARRRLAALTVAALVAAASAGTCMRCSDDFATFQLRRGRGCTTNNQGWTVSITSGSVVNQHSDPSPGWRVDIDGVTDPSSLMRQIFQGPPNFWIDPALNVLKYAVVDGAGTGVITRSATELAGPLHPRPTTGTTWPSTYTSGAFQASTRVLDGAYGGSYFLGEGYGLVQDFEEVAADFSVFDPSNTGSTVGLVFNARSDANGKSYYAVLARNQTGGGNEVGISVIKVMPGSATVSLGKTSMVSIAVNRGTKAGMDGPRAITRIHASKVGNNIRVWLNNNNNTIVLDVTDSTSPLGAGMVGMAFIGCHAAVVDNFVLVDAPSCSNGFQDGDETGVDCGGSCPGVCPSTTQSYTWTAATDGHYGMSHAQYGDNPNGAIFGVPVTYPDGQDYMVQPSNANGAFPGSAGTNAASWTGAWYLYNTHWPAARDVDFSVELQPGDNDYMGIMWRFQDRDNMYILNARNEVGSGTPALTIQRRRNGRNTVVWQSPASYVAHTGATTGNPSWVCTADPSNYPRVPYNQCVRQVWRIRMIGARIELYMPPFDTYANLVANALTPPLFAIISDPDPLSTPGQVGVIVTTHDHVKVWKMSLLAFPFTAVTSPAALALPVSTLTRDSLAFGYDGSLLPNSVDDRVEAVLEYSTRGRLLHTSTFMVSSTALPYIKERQCGRALDFNAPGQLLYSHLKGTDGDPGVRGFTMTAVFAVTAAPAAGQIATIVSKGARHSYQAGWRLYVANPGSGNRVYFEAVSSSYGDKRAIISAPYTLGSTSVVMVTVTPDPDTASDTRIEQRRFTVSATLNNITFADSADFVYTGVIATGEDADLYVGSLQDGSASMTGQVNEVQVFGRPMPAGDQASLFGYLASKHAAARSSCPNIATLSGLDNVTFTSLVACTSPTEGGVCTMACAPGTMMVAGAGRAVCASGVWQGDLPVCRAVCPVDVNTVGANVDAQPCTQDLFVESWSKLAPAGLSSCAADPSPWQTYPTGSAVWTVSTPGRVTADPTAALDTARLFSKDLFTTFEPSLTVPGSRLVLEGQVPFASLNPTLWDASPTSMVEFFPRFIDEKTYYSVRINYGMPSNVIGTVTVSNSTVLVRVVNGISTTLCTAGAGALPYDVLSLATHTVSFWQSGRLTVATNGVQWCDLASENLVPIGDPGYGLAGTRRLDFGPMRVAVESNTCPTGTLRSFVPSGSSMSVMCNTGFAAAGSSSRTCRGDGTWSGTPYTCSFQPPVITNVSVSVPEGSPEGTQVAQLTSQGVPRGSTVQYTIVSGNSGQAFTIGGCDGILRLARPAALDFEGITGNSSFYVEVQALILGTTAVTVASVTVTVTDANDPPMVTNTICSVNENALVGSVACALNVVDQDTQFPSFTTTLLSLDVPGAFTLLGTSLVVATSGLNFEAKSTYSATVRVVDNTDATSFSTASITINVVDLDEPPVISGPRIIQVPASAMVAGAGLAQFIQAVDPDLTRGNAVASYSVVTRGSFPTLLSVNVTNGQLQAAITGTYTLGGLYEKDGFIVADYSEVTLRATDNTPVTGLTGVLDAKVYIMGDVSATTPVVRRVEVVAATAASGAGTSTLGVHTLATAGSDSVNFYVDNLVAPTGSFVECLGSTTTGSTRTWTTTCTYDGVSVVNGNNVPTILRCPTAANYGTDWRWALTLVSGSTRTPITPTTSMAFTYGVPVITGVTVEALTVPPFDIPPVATTGGVAITVAGHNFAGNMAPVTVQYGPADPITGVVNYLYTLTVTGAGITHTTVRGLTVAGDGANLRFQVTVGGTAVAAGPTVTLSYAAASISNITLVSGAAPSFLNGAGGDVLVIRGSNMGLGRTAMPVLYYGPAITGQAPTPANLPLRTVNPTTGVSTCTYAVAHTEVRCTVVTGLGRSLVAVLEVGGAVSAQSPTRLSFAAPVVTGISGPGSYQMDTKGGQSFVLTGSSFGPAGLQGPGLAYPAPVVTYGPSTAVGMYTADSCAITGTGSITSITCLTAEGSGGGRPLGTGFSFSVTVGNQTSVVWKAPAPCEYGSPKVNTVTLGTSMSTAGAAAAPFITGPNALDTTGYQLVNIRGKNFGPFNESGLSPTTGLGYEVFFYQQDVDVFNNGSVREVRYRAPYCARWSPTADPLYLPLRQYHEQIYCFVSPGAGIGLRWEVVVSGRVSTEPTTSYAAPVINTVSAVAGNDVRVVAASDVGGDRVYLRGDFFGQVDATNALSPRWAPSAFPNFVQWVRYGPTGADGRAAYTPRAWSVTADHTTIAVDLAPGIGKGLVFQVSVADQVSAIPATPASSFTFDYASPLIRQVEPRNSSTMGGTLVRVYVTGAGMLDPTTQQSLSLAGVPVPIVERFPSLIDVRRAADGNGSTLSADQLDQAQHYLAFYTPPGVGLSLPISVTAFRVDEASSTVSNRPASEFPDTWVDYYTPDVQYISVERVSSPALQAQVATLFPGTNLADVRIMTVLGESFGTLASAAGKLQLQISNDTSFTTFETGHILNHTDSTIIALVQFSRGYARLALYSPLPTDPIGTQRWWNSETREFTDLAPSVQGITGIPDGGCPTAGGSNILVQARNLASFTTLTVYVGNFTAAFTSLDGLTVLTAAQVLATVITPQAVEQRGRGIADEDMVFTLGIRVPAGQGSSVPVVVVRDNIPGSGSATIKYAAPVLTQVRLASNATFTPVSAISASNPYFPFRVPTTGAELYVDGTNLGTCPIYYWGVFRGAACARDQLPGDRLTLVARSHTRVRFRVPEGMGSGGGVWTTSLLVGDQPSQTLATAYDVPRVNNVTAVDRTTGLPTQGGVQVAVYGTGFGPLAATVPIVTFRRTVGTTVTTFACGNVTRATFQPHVVLTCILPEGSGARLDAVVTVDDQTFASHGAMSYDAAIVTALETDRNSTAGRSTAGGYTVVVRGSNFGPRQAAGHCLFVPFPGVPGSSLVCNGGADSWDEAEVVDITSWNHSVVQFTMPAGMGVRQVRLAVAGALSSSNGTDADVFRYDAPVITKVTPATADTDGATEITVEGRNFGFGSTASANADRLAAGYVPRAPVLPAAGQEGAYPSPFALRVNFFSAQRCITSAVLADTPDNTPPASVATCLSDATGYGVVTHTHTKVVFKALPGVGKNRTLSLSIVNPDGSDTRSNGVIFSYTPPTLESATPSILRMAAPAYELDEVTGAVKSMYVAPQRIEFAGRNFGPVGQEATWTAEERVIEVRIDGEKQTAPARLLKGSPAQVKLQVSYPSYADGRANNLLVNLYQLPKVGFKNVSALIAGQYSSPHYFGLLQSVCDVGFYGQPGELCETCPEGAQCDGYRPDLARLPVGATAENVRKYGAQRIVTLLTEQGMNVTECLTCHTQPRALPGFFNMKGYVNGKGESESICTGMRKAEGKRTAVQCEHVVACEPPESCLGDNVCSDGYANKEWPYRCAQCADGFYRSAGSCRKCPDNPALNIVFFFVVAVVAIGAGWLLNQKQINIAFLTIGLDYMQVISIFANTRVTWPPQIKELFRILSAFNLNIEIVAPECAFTGLKYGQKWGMIMALPIAVNALLLVIYVCNVAWAIGVKRQGKKVAGTMASPLIAMAQVLMYFLYLYLTRSVFDIFTCRSAIPAEYDSAGNEITYMAGVVERCGIKGGTQEQLLPGAVVALLVYVLGYPAAIAANLWTNRDLVMEDQLLRAKRTGDDRMSNPHALEFRRRFARAYYQFRPDMFLWLLAILLRKFLIAISSLVFSTNANFQMAAMLLVLFLAYAAQVRFRPYMGPANFDEVLKDHQEAARNGHPIHARLLDIIARVQAQGRKRTHANTFGGARKVTASALASSIGRFLFDYNTVEALLLASALLVSLSGVMFGAAGTTASSTFYQQSRDGVLSAVIILVIISILYWLTVVVLEITFLLQEQGPKAKASTKGKGKKGSSADDSEEGESSQSRGDGSGEVVMGPVETTTNPLLLGKGGKANASAAGISTDVVQQLATAPEGAVWMAVRDAYVAQQERAAAVAEEVARLKAEVARARLSVSTADGPISPTDGASEGASTPRSPSLAQKKRSFGPAMAEGASGALSIGGRNPLGAGKGKSPGLRLKQ